ncbi:MAG: cysteine--tRNA ligase [Armatimonadetes bacterium]|nr:cysteine--tRNA ligase [Armatimonadota bacterium]
MSERQFKLTDTLSRTKRPLECLEPGHLKFYTCGPTVYSFAHIGNFRSFLTADLVVRTAKALGWKVTWVSNITDVGHLTDDDVADATGEDKMAKALHSKDGQRFHNAFELAEYYTEAFREDWDRLNLNEPDVRPKATQHVREQILHTEELVRLGHAYETPSAVYFNVGSFPGYGKLSGNTQDKLMEAVREVVQDTNKRTQADFALWKKDDKHLMQWFSPWGWGFPGWHIECSAMARAYLGDQIDLHSGGEDNIFPHHECEIAQTEALTGKAFSRYWLHTRFLFVEGQKMSKSLGNFYTVRDLVDGKGASPLALRYALISQNYGTPHNFTLDLLKDATQKVERYRLCEQAAETALKAGREGEDALGNELDALYGEALDAMCDDLNTSVALAKALEGTRVILREADTMSKASAGSAKRFLESINGLLGIVRHDRAVAEFEFGGSAAASRPDEAHIQAKIVERAEAKKAKDFARADAIRKELDEQGIELRDSPEGTTWRWKGQF